ncbi:MAG: TRAP transporter small permease subunit [Cloacibacillus sp.]
MCAFLQKVDNVIENIMKIILPTLITLIAILMTLQVILRYCLHMPMQSVEELILVPSLWLYFLGSIQATRKESHMNARLLEIYTNKLSHIAIIRSLSALGGVIISSWLTYWAYDLLKYSLRMKKTSMVLGFRLTIVECMPFICFALMTVYMFFELIRYYKMARQTPELKGEI